MDRDDRQMDDNELIYDWNGSPEIQRHVELDDETLRDGLQSPSVRNPGIGEKLKILHLMADIGIDAADIHEPARGLRELRAQVREGLALLRRNV